MEGRKEGSSAPVIGFEGNCAPNARDVREILSRDFDLRIAKKDREMSGGPSGVRLHILVHVLKAKVLKSKRGTLDPAHACET